MKTILFLAANPKKSSHLRLGEEAREIDAGLTRSKRRDQFKFEQKWATRPRDLQRAMLDFNPQILHFSGHGTGDSGLVLEDETGQATLVDTQALSSLFGLFANRLECVLLNACYSEVQASAIAQNIPYVIGMSHEVDDRAAREFAIGFYDALGAGRSIEEAFDLGCSSIRMAGIQGGPTPVLKKRSSSVPVHSTLPTISLDEPGGQVPLNSTLYIERPPIEARCYEMVVKPGSLIRIKAPRQMGKTSLMTRILSYGSQQGYRAASVDFQEADADVFTNLEQFLKWFCATVAEELGLPNQLAEFWQQSALGSKQKCRHYFQQYLLPNINSALVLGLDKVDLIFQHLSIAQDFFDLLRGWYERGRNDSLWQRLRLVIVHSKEVYISLDVHRSPFNVGIPIGLPEFTQPQVRDLIHRHSLSLTVEEIEQLMALVGGHPYLIRVALYELTHGVRSLSALVEVALMLEGPYDEHLRRHLKSLQKNFRLSQALKQVVASNVPVQIGSDEAEKLQSMGLVKCAGKGVVPLCGLYYRYFRDRL